MARPTNRLSARAVQHAKPGMHADGAGLYLLVTTDGTASWIFRYRRRKRPGDPPGPGKLRDMGLGAAADFTLADARERARQARKLLADGLDPIEHRRALRAITPRLWGEAKADFIAAKRAEWKSTPIDPDAEPGAQEQQWRQSLDDYGPADALPMDAIDTEMALACLRPIWKPTAQGGRLETATRVRGRCERIWDAEKVRGTVSGENPFRWRGHLEHLLPRPGKVQKPRHFAAMPYADVPAFMRRLREREGRSRAALRVTILAALRTEEVIGAEWREIDLRHKLWTIPAHRMKAGEEHIVPLSAALVAELEALPRDEPPFALSNGAMLNLLQDPPPKGFGLPYTVHGFRSSFHDWASEEGDWPEHVIDQALAHKIPDEVKAAYRRGKLLVKRRELMDAWAAYLAAPDTPHPTA